ncbi:hypothetical protein PsorP6_014863 [Peronosclerospora sorghi]|uniref:Uncharacterized protein n=1 Tax=Peronosclerospora sorghi TaxID=230839 RepID=A0ACC0VSE5_9STRA|nr:hypothetical protein PsorP6_014863 [Peronosclerospora sorghi]
MSDGNVSLAACGLAPSILGTTTYELAHVLLLCPSYVLMWFSSSEDTYVLRAALFRAGFRYQTDFTDMSARTLASEAQISVEEAVKVLEIAQDEATTTLVGKTALDLLQEVTNAQPLSTRLLGLDGLLGGGFQRGEVEAQARAKRNCGVATEKSKEEVRELLASNFCIHACLAAQCLKDEAGKPPSVIFVDSEGSFLIERVAPMAEHFLEDFYPSERETLTRDDLLRGITYYRVHDYLEQIEVLRSLPASFRGTDECTLVVIDTISFHFRHGFEEYASRTRALDDLAIYLHQLAADFNLSILVTNHITTKVSSKDPQRSQLQPALGTTVCPFFPMFTREGWAHSVANRVVLEWERETGPSTSRVARLIKSAAVPHDSTFFKISERGVRDV